MADSGHEPAQWALRDHIAAHIEQDRFAELPVSIRAYNAKVLRASQLPGYGRGNKAIDTWTRDSAIALMVKLAMQRWTLRKKRAAGLVAMAVQRHGLKLKLRSVLDIFDNGGTLAARLVTFMLAAVPDLGTVYGEHESAG
jgi:hypothetical protein